METCEACDSNEFTLIGILGAVMHVRCRYCGMTGTQYIDEIGDDERDE